MAEFRSIEDGFVGEQKILFKTIDMSPKHIGGYDITGNKGKQYSIQFNMTKKPNWFHRLCTKLFLGWDWVDTK